MNIDYSKTNDYLIGIDSDGCAFDTMELKHKECFIPNIIHHWGLKGVSKYAREAAEFVNLYSKTRGVNRFPALIEVFRLLNKRPEVVARRPLPVEVGMLALSGEGLLHAVHEEVSGIVERIG